MELKVGGKYKFTKKLGNGAFGDIFMGLNMKTNEEVAIKLESLKSKFPQLQYEAKLYKVFEGGGKLPYITKLILVGFSQVHYFGVEGEYNVMVIDILGPNLEALFQFCERKFSLKTILMIGLQCVTRLEFLHSKEFIHRDIKPENFLIGIGKKQHLVYSIDFGLAKRYRDPKTGDHIAFKENKGMTGTARYASINAHYGYEQSRRDDLEAIGYVLAYFLRDGELPWMGLRAKRKNEKYEKIKECKANTKFEDLLEGHPAEFIKYMNYCRNLAFDQKPDYSYLKKLFESLMSKNGWEEDADFDWHIKKQQKLKELEPPTEEEDHQAQIDKNQKRNPNSKSNAQKLQERTQKLMEIKARKQQSTQSQKTGKNSNTDSKLSQVASQLQQQKSRERSVPPPLLGSNQQSVVQPDSTPKISLINKKQSNSEIKNPEKEPKENKRKKESKSKK